MPKLRGTIEPFWIDVTTTHLEGSADFYASLFGWSSNPTPDPREPGYQVLGRPERPALAGIDPVPVAGPPVEWAVFLRVPDLAAAEHSIANHGGRISQSHIDFLGWGAMSIVTDPWGADLCLVETSTWTGLSDGRCTHPGDPLGAMLCSPEREEAGRWYGTVLGIEIDAHPSTTMSRWLPILLGPAANDVTEIVGTLGGEVLREEIGHGARLVADPAGARFALLAGAGDAASR